MSMKDLATLQSFIDFMESIAEYKQDAEQALAAEDELKDMYRLQGQIRAYELVLTAVEREQAAIEMDKAAHDDLPDEMFE